jgi:hypothetical protein
LQLIPERKYAILIIERQVKALLNYSNFICEAMTYVDKKIDEINPQSLDRNRLHSKVKTQIIANAKRLAPLDHSEACKEIDRIFNKCLLDELTKLKSHYRRN